MFEILIGTDVEWWYWPATIIWTTLAFFAPFFVIGTFFQTKRTADNLEELLRIQREAHEIAAPRDLEAESQGVI
jgi:hypothetical protein